MSSEQEYLLTLERRQPSGDRERLVTVRGKIRNLRKSHETGFRLWLEDDSSSRSASNSSRTRS